MTPWLRLWNDMPNDPKWRTIARVSGASISEVISVYLHVLVSASNATERGRTHANAALFAEDVATALDIQTCTVQSILESMQGRVLEGDKVSGWDKRQPQREDNSADRAKDWREKQKSERNRTQPNATERQIREEKRREEIHAQSAPSARVVADLVSKESEVLRWFEQEFWPAYPHKKSKYAAIAACKKRAVTPEIRARIIAAVKQQTPMILGRPSDKRPYPATWINAGSWQDEPDEPVLFAHSNGKIHDPSNTEYRD